MNDCVFCQIAAKKVPAKIQYEDEDVIAFDDINPKAPVHILIVPKKHIASLNELTQKEELLAGKLVFVARKIAKDKGFAKEGFRIVINSGRGAGQIVDHLHLHLLSGKGQHNL